MNVLDLFSGIGGFSLGLERAGMRTVAFCEIDPFCRKVLARHWPDVPIFGDIRELTAARLVADANSAERQARDGISIGNGALPPRHSGASCGRIDVICGGFPCQDISVAGKGAGIEGERSGLWSEYARIIGELRPRYVIVENVAALLGRGLDRVLGDLATLGYDAEWHCIPASAVGAPHRRDRVWIVANTISARLEGCPAVTGHIADQLATIKRNGSGSAVADTSREHVNGTGATGPGRRRQPSNGCGDDADAGQWFTEPNVGRVAHGVPARVDRLRSLGNAVVPQIPEIIGRAIMRASA